MRFFLLFLTLILCGCCASQKADVFLEKQQEAIATEIVSIQHAFVEVMIQLNNTNAAAFATKADHLINRLDKILKDLDTLGRFPMDLREATLKKLGEDDKASEKLLQSAKVSSSPQLQPEVLKILESRYERYFSAFGSIDMKAGLYYYTTNSTDTNGVEYSHHL
jgi:hypothetical protein